MNTATFRSVSARRFTTGTLALIALVSGINAIAQPEITRTSLVRIEAVSQTPDYTTPWNPGNVSRGVGAGFVIANNRIMTNAHVVSDARFLAVRKEGDPNPYPARVLHIAHDCDLAVLELADPSFFDGTTPLEINGIPELESTVIVYGYPIGGDRPSVTRGIVSRIDFQSYSHSGADAHLVIQIDAAINPGNSGGPVMQDGQVVGVAFQGFSGDVAQSTGYMIPAPVIKRFLKDIEDGTYDRYVDIAITYNPLINPAARKALGVADREDGVIVSSVISGGSSDGIVEKGDVILAIDGHPVAKDGSVDLDGTFVELAEIVERKFKGDSVTLNVLRNGEPLELVIPALTPFPFNLYANAYDVRPRYLIFAGLIFQPLDQNFIQSSNLTDPRTTYYFENFLSEHLYRDHPELIVLSNILSDPVNSYAEEFRHSIVEKVNETPIRTLDDLAAAFEKPAESYTIEFIGATRPLVFTAESVKAARERVMNRYAIPQDANLNSKP